jgi:hypothetical protein
MFDGVHRISRTKLYHYYHIAIFWFGNCIWLVQGEGIFPISFFPGRAFCPLLFWHFQKIFRPPEKHRVIMTTPRYWILVASQEHVKLGVAGGFAQAGHGTQSGIARMHAGDRILYYSPKVAYGRDELLHAVTALGEVVDDKIVQVRMSPDFKPFR